MSLLLLFNQAEEAPEPAAPLITSGGWSEWPVQNYWPEIKTYNEDEEIMLLSLVLTELVQ